jgi:cellulose synthase/poly-beta-1,6-N-acetylglucosamine synthase-like glycosyltransferase
MIAHFAFFVCLSLLCYGNYVYFFCRQGYLKRSNHFKETQTEELRRFFAERQPSLIFLVPSYKEEIDVVRQTLLSSALQEYSKRSVVLLIDDPTYPADTDDRLRLEAVRRLPKELKELITPLAIELSSAAKDFEERTHTGSINLPQEHETLAELHRKAAEWFENLRSLFPSRDHVTKHFVALTIDARIAMHLDRADAFMQNSSPFEEIRQEYSYFSTLFDVEISTFERKKYLNLSHAPNKAMNLNSYLMVMGGTFEEQHTPEGILLAKSAEGTSFADSEYVAMLDADTILTHDYAARLVFEMEKAENNKVAVIQTPYSAFPGSPGVLERIAGATTDIQYIIHQGFTRHNATFWVGANALIRKNALDDIVEFHDERGFTVAKFIQDHTVIEDTESSIDLVNKGWQLTNYPRRLSYSATPPDYGSLLIQRRRWANGGLLILPKLFSYLFSAPFRLKAWVESFFRFHYLFSIAGMLVTIPVMTVLSFVSTTYTLIFLFASLPYLYLYSRDLSQIGYRSFDIFRVIALNTLLIPVNAAGVIKSIEQAFTGVHTPFCRTPKISGRTVVPTMYIIITLLLCLWCLIGMVWGVVVHGTLDKIICCALYSLPLLYGTFAYFGVKEMLEDGLKPAPEKMPALNEQF